MRRRLAIPLLIAATLLAAAALLPGTPAGRGWLLERAVGAVRSAGYELGFDRHRGNPWRGVALEGATLRGPGLDLGIDRLDVAYFLPALLTGSLPLDVALANLDGSLEPSALATPQGGGGGGPRILLRSLALDGVALRIDGAALSLPSLALERLETAVTEAGQIALDGVLVAREGRVPFRGSAALEPIGFDLAVEGAELTAARHWWDGIQGGWLDATVRFADGALSVDGSVRDGSVALDGVAFDGLNGPVRMRDLEIEANLDGFGLGGAVAADGTVDIVGRRWEANYRATPTLSAGAAWLLPTLLDTIDTLRASADLAVQGRIGGWRAFTTEGTVRGAGALLERPFDVLALGYAFGPEGLELDAALRWAGGTLGATLETRGRDLALSASANGLELVEAGARLQGGGDLAFRRDGDGDRAEASATVTVGLPDRSVELELDAVLDADGWQAFAAGEDELGGRIEGAAVFAADRLAAGATLTEATLPGVPIPLDLRLAADGPLAALAVELELLGPAEIAPEFDGIDVALDLRGGLSGTLSGTRLALAGALGPLALTLDGGLGPLSASVDYALDPVTLGLGPQGVRLETAVTAGTFTWSGGAWQHRADLAIAPTTLGVATTPELRGVLAMGSDDTWRFAAADGSLEAALDLAARTIELDTEALPIDVAGVAAEVSGRAALSLDDPVATLSGDLEASALGRTVALRASGSRVAFEGGLPSGLALGPVSLAQSVAVAGAVDLSAATLEAELRSEGVAAALSGGFTSERPLRGTIDTADRSATATLDLGTLAWTFDGGLDLSALGLIGVAVDGRLDGAVSGRGLDVDGALAGTIDAPVATTLELSANGGEVTVGGNAVVAGFDVAYSGSVLPERTLRAEVGSLGAVTLVGDLLAGSGTLPELALGPLTYPGEAWSLTGSLSEARATVEAGRSRADATWRGGWRVDASIATEAAIGSEPVAVTAEATVGSALPRGSVEGRAEAAGGAATFEGSIDRLTVGLDIAAAAIASIVGIDAVVPTGAVALAGSVDPLEGPAVDLSGGWRGDGYDLDLTVQGRGAVLRAEADGSGIRLAYEGGGVEGAFTGAALHPFVGDPPAEAIADGALAFDADGWRGDLTLTLAAPVEADIRLSGRAGALHADAAWSSGALQAVAQGTLLPALDLDAVLDLAGRGEVRLTAAGPLTDPTIAGRATVREQNLLDLVDLPAVGADIRLDLAAGTLHVEGEGIAAEIETDRVEGAVDLGLRVAGLPHLARLEIGGSPTSPRLSLVLDGPLAAGTADYDDDALALDVDLDPSLLPTELPAGLTVGTATIVGTLGLDGGWLGSARAPVRYRGLDVTAVADLGGRGLAFEGALTVYPDRSAAQEPPLAVAALSVEGAAAQVAVDLATLDLTTLGGAFGVDVVGRATGSATLTTSPATLRIDGGVAGEVEGVALDLQATFDGERLELGVTAVGVTARASGPLRNLDLAVEGALPAGEVALAGALDLADGSTLDLSGVALGRSAEASASLRGDAGTVTATFGGSRLEAVTQGGPGDLTVRASLATEPLAGLGPIVAEIGLVRLEDGWTTEIAADLPESEAVRHLTLAGALLPEIGLTGRAELLDPVGPVTLRIDTRGGALGDAVVTVGRDDLALRAELRAAVEPTSVALLGTGGVTLAGTDWRIDAGDLRWGPEEGFAGEGRLSGLLLDTALEATLIGGGGLSAEVAAVRPGLDLEGRIELASRPWADPAIAGSLRFSAGAALLPDAPLPADTELSGSATVGGSWRDPSLAGALSVRGPVEAAGPWSWIDGGAEIELAGERLEVSLAADGNGWRGDAAVTAWPLADLAPWIADPTLSIRGSGGGDWGGAVAASVETLTLSAPGSSAEGRGTLRIDGGATTYTAVVRLDLDLADATIGTPLRGRIRGPIALSGAGDPGAPASLSGLLTLASGGAADGSDASLSGTLQLSGDVADPSIQLALEGLGSAAGGLRGDVQPLRPQITLTSDLRFAGLESDLSLRYDGASYDAEGTVAFGDLRLRFQGAPEGLALRGEAGLAGVEGTVDPSTLAARLSADLGALVPNAAGSAELTLAPPGGTGPWLLGSIGGAEIAGVALGDLTLRAETLGGAVAVSGPGIDAAVDPFGGATWTASVAALPLGPDLDLAIEAAGTGARGSGRGRLSGTLAGAELDLEVEASLGDAAAVRLSGGALGGSLALDAGLVEGAWSGTATLSGATLAGQRIDLRGAVGGPADDPALTATLRSDGAVPVSAEAIASIGGVEVAGSAEIPSLARPLRFRGPLWPAPALTLAFSDADGLRVAAPRLTADAPLGFAGSLSLDLGPATVTLVGDGSALTASARSDPLGVVPALAVESEALAGSANELWAQLDRGGLALAGRGGLAGDLRIFPSAVAVELEGVAIADGGLSLEIDGRFELRGDTALRGRLEIDGDSLPFTTSERLDLPFDLTGDRERWSLALAGGRGSLDLDVERDTLDSALVGRLEIGGGTIEADLALSGGFAAGLVALDGVRLSGVPGLAGFSLSGRIDALGERLGGRLDLDDLAGRGGLDLTLGYPVAALLDGAPSLEELDVEARVRTFAVGSLPAVANLAPNLVGEVSGVAQLRNGLVVGRLVAPALSVFDTPLPADLEFNGSAAEVELRGNVAGSALSGTLTPTEMQALMRFERFPLQSVAEAAAGRSDISAELTGVARLTLPFGEPAASELRVATELIRLERDGVVTEGNATFDYLAGALRVERVAFEGAGSWQASGVIRSGLLDFRASAVDADFGPLLGIVPALARLDTGARGSLDLVATGSLQRPTIDLRSEALEVAVAGSNYRLEGALATLRGRDLTLDATLVGVAPIVGRIVVSGGGTLSLEPLRLEEAGIDLTGGATVPILGEVTELNGTIAARDGAPYLLSEGRVGNPFTLEGSLVPLDLRLVGEELAIRAPTLLLASSVMDADVTLRYGEALDIGGALTASEARFQLGIRPPSEGGGGGGRRALERVRFDAITITAPGRIFLSESFAALEARAQLTLGGTAARPQLEGSASALRGSIRFSGRDFAIERGIATFEPTRGAYPLIDLIAITSFDKSRVIPAGSGVRFVEPRGSARFDVRLGFQGALDARSGGGLDLDFDPDLSSDALIEVEAEAALASGPRPLTTSELLALVTLGRLDISSILAGNGGLVTAVAQGALDTAVDLLVLAELQQALGEALGVEVVEIRTTALSSLLDGDVDDPFGVSLRLGGYLSEELFASFQIGSFDDEEGAFALTNEVRLTYVLGPVTFDLAGGVNVPADGTQLPIPKLSSSVGYSFNTLLGIEAGVDLSSERSQLRVGLTLRW